MKLKIKLRNILSVKIHKIVLLLLALCIYNTAYGQNQRISVYAVSYTHMTLPTTSRV